MMTVAACCIAKQMGRAVGPDTRALGHAGDALALPAHV